MSRNFELLQQLGFQDPVPAPLPPVEHSPRAVVAPRLVERVTAMAPDEHAAGIVKRLYLAAEGAAPQAVSFISLERAHDDTLCARVAENLAAQITGSVCVVDANFERPLTHTHFGVLNNRGFAESLSSDLPIGTFGRRIAGTDLFVIPAGLARPSATTERLAERIRELREQFDYTLIRTPMGADAADACFIARLTGNAVLVIEAHTTRRTKAARVKLQLEQNGVAVLGAVLNNRTFPVPHKLYSKLF